MFFNKNDVNIIYSLQLDSFFGLNIVNFQLLFSHAHILAYLLQHLIRTLDILYDISPRVFFSINSKSIKNLYCYSFFKNHVFLLQLNKQLFGNAMLYLNLFKQLADVFVRTLNFNVLVDQIFFEP
jgi:hypothetical protein